MSDAASPSGSVASSRYRCAAAPSNRRPQPPQTVEGTQNSTLVPRPGALSRRLVDWLLLVLGLFYAGYVVCVLTRI